MNIFFNDRVRNITLGVCEIMDGTVRILSLGFIHTLFAFKWLCWWELKEIQKMRQKKLKEEIFGDE